MNIEVAILTGAILLLLALIYTAGQVITAENAVAEAARAAARAASIATDGGGAAAARTQAEQTLSRQLDCRPSTVTVDSTEASAPAGTTAVVTATVSCTVSFGALTVPGTPGSHTLTSTFTSPIDRYGRRTTGGGTS